MRNRYSYVSPSLMRNGFYLEGPSMDGLMFISPISVQDFPLLCSYLPNGFTVHAKGCGILCFCDTRGGKEVVIPNQFELHAGSANKWPPEYIYLDNGNTLKEVLSACKAVSLEGMEESILKVIGCLSKEKPTFCLNCRGIVNGLFSNAASTVMKWGSSLNIKTPTKTTMSGMKFESGYNVETVFDGSKLDIEPRALELLPNGDLLLLDSANSNLYNICSSLSLYSRPKLVAGSPDGHSGHVDGRLRDAKMNRPKGLTLEDKGNIYIAGTANMAIRKISHIVRLQAFIGTRGTLMVFRISTGRWNNLWC